MRNRSGKSARLQERFYSDADLATMMPRQVTEEEVEEAIQHEKDQQKQEEEMEDSIGSEETVSSGEEAHEAPEEKEEEKA